mgnify:CR=1 FL=1
MPKQETMTKDGKIITFSSKLNAIKQEKPKNKELNYTHYNPLSKKIQISDEETKTNLEKFKETCAKLRETTDKSIIHRKIRS